MDNAQSPLGNLTPQRFLNDYWQKKPLLIRAALPGADALLRREQLFDLACQEHVESRLVRGSEQHWELEHGPFRRRAFRGRGAPWTLLVQGVNMLLPAADRLLHSFNFIPYARLDDLMVSYAADGGSVGPHLDNYDVFLLQGMGRRRWRISRQRDHGLLEDAPLNILKRFKPTREWVLTPGDMLYLPPQWAHEGVALGECMTFSIGFRAPPAQEIAEAFLSFLQDHLALKGRYQDPNLKPQRFPARIDNAMTEQIGGMLQAVQWNPSLVARFVGCHLSEPKPQVFFAPPRAPLRKASFLAAARRTGIRLDGRTRLLYDRQNFFINGTPTDPAPPAAAAVLRQLANRRELPTLVSADESALDRIYAWYRDGFLHLKT